VPPLRLLFSTVITHPRRIRLDAFSETRWDVGVQRRLVLLDRPQLVPVAVADLPGDPFLLQPMASIGTNAPSNRASSQATCGMAVISLDLVIDGHLAQVIHAPPQHILTVCLQPSLFLRPSMHARICRRYAVRFRPSVRTRRFIHENEALLETSGSMWEDAVEGVG